MPSNKKKPFSLNNIIKEKYNINLSKEEVSYIFNLGAKKFEIGDYENALPIFQFLTLYEPSNALYLKSVAGCFQNLEKFAEAYIHYQSAFIIDIKNSQDCLFYMGYCAIKLQQNDQALELLTKFLKDNSGHDLEKKAKLLLHGLEKTKS